MKHTNIFLKNKEKISHRQYGQNFKIWCVFDCHSLDHFMWLVYLYVSNYVGIYTIRSIKNL